MFAPPSQVLQKYMLCIECKRRAQPVPSLLAKPEDFECYMCASPECDEGDFIVQVCLMSGAGKLRGVRCRRWNAYVYGPHTVVLCDGLCVDRTDVTCIYVWLCEYGIRIALLHLLAGRHWD